MGLEIDVDEEADTISNICQQHRAREIQKANTKQERALLWKLPQAGIRSDRPAVTQLLHSGRSRPTNEGAGDSEIHLRMSVSVMTYAF